MNLDFDGDLEFDSCDDEDSFFQQAEEIQIELASFANNKIFKRDIQEFCKPFSFESFVQDSDDCCKIAAIVIRKLLSDRVEEFSEKML